MFDFRYACFEYLQAAFCFFLGDYKWWRYFYDAGILADVAKNESVLPSAVADFSGFTVCGFLCVFVIH